MTTNELASLLANHTGPVTDQALRQLAVSVKFYLAILEGDTFGRVPVPPAVQRALKAVEEAVKVEANDGA